MSGEVQRQEERYQPTDPRRQAYLMGKELMRRAGMAGGEVAPAADDQPFDHPFFNSGQTKRVQRTKRSVHVINENEYIVTEETTYEDVQSFGQDIFKDK